MSEITDGTIVERIKWECGTIWIHVWRRERPGLLHLVWEMEVCAWRKKE